MHSKVSSDWLPSYIKVKRTVFEIFKMAGYFPDSPHKKLKFSYTNIIDRMRKHCASTNYTTNKTLEFLQWYRVISKRTS